MSLRFERYQALGNDYLVVEGVDWQRWDRPEVARRICDRHFGLGSDGILVRATAESEGPERLRILNADGSEAEKSGNGLRIFARYLFDRGLVQAGPFAVLTLAGPVRCQVSAGGADVSVEMGRVVFATAEIPLVRQEVGEGGSLDDQGRGVFVVGGRLCDFQAASIGNPHCAILVERASEADARSLGPLIERHPLFPRKTNVQFLQVVDRHRIRLEIWERGSGYTLSSGSCASAGAAIARRLELVGPEVVVEMRGGEALVSVSDRHEVTLRGPVQRIADIEPCAEFLNSL
jgi:diaminopimelate epimerase